MGGAGWFNLFRCEGSFTFYPQSNRTSVVVDLPALTIYVVFATLLLAFLIILPGIRKERLSTFGIVTLSLFMGGTTLVGIYNCGWHTGEAQISAAYRAHSNEKIHGKIGVYFGLYQVNVTLLARSEYYNKTMDMAFNEKFGFERPDQLKEEYKKGLIKGLPFPILTVAEYIAVDAAYYNQAGFGWGLSYRQAGFYGSFFLWFSFALWLLTNLTIVVVPRYGAYLMSLTGAMLIYSDFVYFWLLPTNPLKIPFEGSILELKMGWCFWLVLTTGILSLLVGLGISITDHIYPHKFTTVLEMDYGTPFDRCTLIEDSQETKSIKNLKSLTKQKSTTNLNLWRRFSRKIQDKGLSDSQNQDKGLDDTQSNLEENTGNMDAPNSPWCRKSEPTVSFQENIEMIPTNIQQ